MTSFHLTQVFQGQQTPFWSDLTFYKTFALCGRVWRPEVTISISTTPDHILEKELSQID